MIAPKPSTSYRLLHTADWHLGKLLNDRSRDEEHGLFLEWLLGVVREHGVDAIVLSGDVFDSANPPQSALGRYFDFVSGLHRLGSCSLVVIGGNHDSAAQLEAPKMVLRALNAHVAGYLSEECGNRILLLPDASDPRVGIAMVPFLRDRDLRVGKAGQGAEEIRAQLVSGIESRYGETAAAVKDLCCPVVATGHLTVAGASTSDSERDIHIGGLGAVGSEVFPEKFAYVALGHLHRPQATDAAGRVRYAGSPIALSFGEASDRKEVRILDVTPSGLSHVGLPVPVFRKLCRLRTTQAGLEEGLSSLVAGEGGLRPWVEVVVEDAALENDLVERVRALAEGLPFDVLKVVRGRSEGIGGMAAGDATDDEAIEALLDNPNAVFEHLLGEHESLSGEEIESLKTAFQVLLDLDKQGESEARK